MGCKEEVMQHSVALVGRCQTKFHAQNHVFLYFVGSACRNKVVRWVSVNFKTPADADAHYFGLKHWWRKRLFAISQCSGKS